MPSPVATGGFGGFAVDHSRPPTGQDRLLGPDEELLPPYSCRHGSRASPFVREQIERERLVPESDIRSAAYAIDDGTHHLMPGTVSEGVHDAAMAMSPYARESEMAFSRSKCVPQLMRSLSAPVPRNDQIDNRPVTHAGAPRQSIFDMGFQSGLRERGRPDPALRIGAVALLTRRPW